MRFRREFVNIPKPKRRSPADNPNSSKSCVEDKAVVRLANLAVLATAKKKPKKTQDHLGVSGKRRIQHALVPFKDQAIVLQSARLFRVINHSTRFPCLTITPPIQNLPGNTVIGGRMRTPIAASPQLNLHPTRN